MNQTAKPQKQSDSNVPDGNPRWVPISVNRRLVLDGLSFARRVPLFPAEMMLDLSEIAALRKSVSQRVSWAVLFVKAYAIAAQRHTPLRRTYVRWPWPHLVEVPHSTAMVVVNRQYQNEDRICWGRLEHPESRPLTDLQRQLTRYKHEPVEKVFAQQLRLGRFPAPLRRMLYWWNLNFAGRKRAKRFGTFTMSTLAGEGVWNRMHQSFLTSSLTYGPLDEQGRCLVTLLCDHRVVDGIVAARALADLQAALAGPIGDELKTMATSRAAA
jgi:hypothetical protein